MTTFLDGSAFTLFELATVKTITILKSREKVKASMMKYLQPKVPIPTAKSFLFTSLPCSTGIFFSQGRWIITKFGMVIHDMYGDVTGVCTMQKLSIHYFSFNTLQTLSIMHVNILKSNFLSFFHKVRVHKLL